MLTAVLVPPAKNDHLALPTTTLSLSVSGLPSWLGYLFLLNLFVRIVHADDAIIQADDVYAIFFDVLALELVQKLDDVAQCAEQGDGNAFLHVIPAEIMHCKSEEAWVMVQEGIRKRGDTLDMGCSQWLFVSPKTKEYNLVDVETEWNVWTDVIKTDPKGVHS
eukprot:g9107.t1 g9107   contig35:42006-42652(+)